MTNEEIKTVGQTIAAETQIGGNTAERVGGVIEGIGEALDNKDAANGYYQATINGGTITVNAPNYLLGSGGNLRIEMPSAGTGASTLTIGNASAVQLWYNGAAVSAQNTWEAGEIISVFYDGTRFMASNSQGVGKLDTEPMEDSKRAVESGGVYKSAPSNVDSTNVCDLDISDPDGNVLVSFENGGIKTKSFDSSIDAPTSSIEGQYGDLEIADPDGNVLVSFENGGVKTKNFNSNKYTERPITGYENFLYDVNITIPSQNTAMTLQDGVDLKKDRGIIVLPINYTPNGEAIRLIIANQGSSGVLTSNSTTPNTCCPLVDVMLAEGYAVLQINGTPNYTNGIATYGAAGNPDYLKSIIKAYEYVINKYNIKRDGVFLAGYSQGVLKNWQIAANKVLPVIACVGFGPCLDLWKLMYPYCSSTHRQFIFQRFGFIEKEANDYVLEYFGNLYQQGDIVRQPTTFSNVKVKPNDNELSYILNNYDLWKGYDPMCWGTTENIIGKQFSVVNWVTVDDPNEDAIYADVGIIIPCRTKLFIGTNDQTTTMKLTRWYKRMADNSGIPLDVRYYQGGDHSYPSSYPTITVNTKYGGTITTNLPSWEGMLFLERFDF